MTGPLTRARPLGFNGMEFGPGANEGGKASVPLAGFGWRVTLEVSGRAANATQEFQMTSRATLLAATAAAVLAFGSLPAGAAMPVSGAAKVDAGKAVVQAQATAPATGTPPAAAAPTATAPATATPPAGGETKAAKKKSAKKKSETDQSIESGTVPKRYRSSVPKEYHHLIPFAK